MLSAAAKSVKNVDVQVRTLHAATTMSWEWIVGVHQDRHPARLLMQGSSACYDLRNPCWKQSSQCFCSRADHEVAPDTLLGGKRWGRPGAVHSLAWHRDRAADGEDDKGLIQREGDFVGIFSPFTRGRWRTLKKQYEEIRRFDCKPHEPSASAVSRRQPSKSCENVRTVADNSYGRYRVSSPQGK